MQLLPRKKNPVRLQKGDNTKSSTVGRRFYRYVASVPVQWPWSKGGTQWQRSPFFAWPLFLVFPLTTFQQAALQLLLLPLGLTRKIRSTQLTLPSLPLDILLPDNSNKFPPPFRPFIEPFQGRIPTMLTFYRWKKPRGIPQMSAASPLQPCPAN